MARIGPIPGTERISIVPPARWTKAVLQRDAAILRIKALLRAYEELSEAERAALPYWITVEIENARAWHARYVGVRLTPTWSAPSTPPLTFDEAKDAGVDGTLRDHFDRAVKDEMQAITHEADRPLREAFQQGLVDRPLSWD